MSDFIGNGGDGYTMMAKYEVFKEGLLTDTDAIAYYIKNDLKGIIPAEYRDFQGRINLVNGSIPSISSSNLSSISSSISIVLKKLALFIILTL